jgi:hypothetical protein
MRFQGQDSGVHDSARPILFREFLELLVRIAKAKFVHNEPPPILPDIATPPDADLPYVSSSPHVPTDGSVTFLLSCVVGVGISPVWGTWVQAW